MKARNQMRRATITLLSLLAVFSFTVSSAFAGLGIRKLVFSGGVSGSTSSTSASASMISAKSAPFKNTLFAAADSIACQGNDLQLAVCFTLSGVGSTPVNVVATVTGLASTICTNKGGTSAPGRNPVLRTAMAQGTFASDKNGNVVGILITPPPGYISAQDAGCPNNNWTAKPVAVDFLSLHFVVQQNGATPVDQTFDLPNN